MTQRAFEYILVERRGGVATITLNRPPLNVLNIAMLREINSALEEVAADRELRLLVITGRGKTFSAGVDVGEHLPDNAEEMLRAFRLTFDLLGSIEAPTLAAVNGAALGGGCELAVFCDIVIAAESAKVGQPEIKLATIAPVASVILPRLCGVRKAMELLLIGDAIAAREAERIGLVSRVVSDDGLQGEVESVAEKLSMLSPAAIKRAKRAVLENLGEGFFDELDAAEAMCLDMLLNMEDSEEGLRAFLEKRKPVWKGI